MGDQINLAQRMVFINLPVKDVQTATKFYEGIGGEIKPMFSDEKASALAFSESIFVMVLHTSFFETFIPSGVKILDTGKQIQVLNCLSVKEREDVDKICDIADSSGGKKDPTTLKPMPGMYGRSFADPDGHIWELMWMDPTATAEGCPERARKEAEAK